MGAQSLSHYALHLSNALAWNAFINFGVGLADVFLSPLGSRLFIILAVIALFDAAAVIFWLLVFGVNEWRWKEVATSN
jgi:hypothetical protein